MASSRSRTPAPARSARSSSSKASGGTRKAQVEVVEENDGGGLDAGIAIITAILLVTGFFLLDFQLGKHYGDGQFFKNEYQAPN
jgi:hypothetical protein